MGPLDELTVTIRSNLAQGHVALGRADLAHAELERAAADCQTPLGANHPDTVACGRTLRCWRGRFRGAWSPPSHRPVGWRSGPATEDARAGGRTALARPRCGGDNTRTTQVPGARARRQRDTTGRDSVVSPRCAALSTGSPGR